MAHHRVLSTIESEFMRAALDKGLRIDGRKIDTIRETRIEFGAKTGTVEVALGKTRVLARAVHDLGTPRRDKRNEGSIDISCTFPKYCEEAMPRDEIDRICLLIKAGIYESKAIDLESLCVLNGEKVWKIEVALTVIQHDGNIIDCANLAALCALKHHRRPDVTVVGSKIIVHSMVERHPVALSIHHLPICVTLAHVLPLDDSITGKSEGNSNRNNKKPRTHSKAHNKMSRDGFFTFLDPTAQEEKLMDGRTVYCMTRHRELCAVDKIGGVAMDSQSFLGFINELVMNVVKRWSNQIENMFIQHQYQENDARKRKERVHQKVVNAIDVFNFGDLKEKEEEVELKRGDVEDDDVDEMMKDESKGGIGDQMWEQWEKEEQMKLTQIREALNFRHSETRVSANKSVVTSEFD